MGALRSRLLLQLQEADRYGRLRVCYPYLEALGGKFINVHSKVMIVDDRLVRVGSANLSNRSMGLDTECDLAVEADRDETRLGVAAFRARLLAEHLGTTPQRVAETIASSGSLLSAVDRLSGGERGLRPLNGGGDYWLEQVVPEWAPIDPEQPMSLEQFFEEVVARDPDRSMSRRLNRRWMVLAGLLLAALALAAVWRWTPLGDYLNLQTLRTWGQTIQNSPWALGWVVLVFILGGIAVFPVTLLILATALAFTPVPAFFYALLGCLTSAAVTYGIGLLLGHDAIRRFTGSRLNRLSKQLARRGLIAVTIIRFLPVAPFSVVNMMAGASHIRFRDFLGGTLLGMGPGVLAITVFEHSLMQAIRQPELENFLLLAAVILAVLGATWLLRRWLRLKESPADDAAEDRQ